jgi:hypothetical protein
LDPDSFRKSPPERSGIDYRLSKVWSVIERGSSVLASLTGCYRPAINTFIEVRKQQIDELNARAWPQPRQGQNTPKCHS